MDFFPEPTVSVLVPIYNERDSIGFVLESLFRQDYQEAFEILLIDGMSSDGTRDEIRKFLSARLSATNNNEKERDDFHFRDLNIICKIIKNPNKTQAFGLNAGIKMARGDYIIRMDAHTEYDPRYITECVKWLKKEKAENVGGPTESVPGSNTIVAKGIALASSNIFGVGNSKFRTSKDPQYVNTVPFGAWPKQLFEKIGLFDERLTRGQDIEFNSRIRRAGGKIYLTPEIKSYYHCDSTLVRLWKKHFANGEWNIYTRVINDDTLSWRHFMPLIFVSSVILGILFYAVSRYPVFYIFTVFIIGSYLIASLFFSLKICYKEGIKYLFVMPVIFMILHFSYGIGSMWGLIALPGWLKKNKSRGSNLMVREP